MKHFLFLFLFLFVPWGASSDEPRNWTSSTGQKLDAVFVSSDGANVVLRRTSDRREFTLPLSRLSAEDQAWIKENANKPAPITGPFAGLITGDWELSKHGDLPFAFFAAKELSAKKSYPLVVSLHGKSNNNENGKQIGFAKTFAKPENYSARPCFVVAPLCYQPYGGTGGGWNDKPGSETIELIKELIDNLPIDKDRVYCVGYSMGGFGTTHLMAEEPRLFTAGVPVAGVSGSAADKLKRHPVWLFHAADDPVVSVDGSRSFAEQLKRNKAFKYTEFPDGGHGIAGRVMNDAKVHEWLFAQKK